MEESQRIFLPRNLKAISEAEQLNEVYILHPQFGELMVIDVRKRLFRSAEVWVRIEGRNSWIELRPGIEVYYYYYPGELGQEDDE